MQERLSEPTALKVQIPLEPFLHDITSDMSIGLCQLGLNNTQVPLFE